LWGQHGATGWHYAIRRFHIFEVLLVVVGVLQWLVLSKTDEALHLAAQAQNSSAQTAEKLRLFTERPLVSLGRKDGTVAEFTVPDNTVPDRKVGLKIYLQNGGQSPALTPNVGLLMGNMETLVRIGQPPPPQQPPILQEPRFQLASAAPGP
jgi:hypothetical protein